MIIGHSRTSQKKSELPLADSKSGLGWPALLRPHKHALCWAQSRSRPVIESLAASGHDFDDLGKRKRY